MTVYRRPDPIPRRPGAATVTPVADLRVRAEHANLSLLVARKIFEAIADGRFPENSILPNEKDLSLELGVSRTALREAINGLAAKGLLEARRRRGTMVLERSRWNMLDADLISWSRRSGDQRVSPELWEAVTAALATLVERAAHRQSAAPLPGRASEALLEIARRGGNRFLLSVVATGLQTLLRDDPAFLDAALSGLSPDILGRLGDQLARGNARAARDLMLSALTREAERV